MWADWQIVGELNCELDELRVRYKKKKKERKDMASQLAALTSNQGENKRQC